MSVQNNPWEAALDYEATPVQQEIDPALAAALSRAISSEQQGGAHEKEKQQLTPVDAVRYAGLMVTRMREVGREDRELPATAQDEEVIAGYAIALSVYHTKEEHRG